MLKDGQEALPLDLFLASGPVGMVALARSVFFFFSLKISLREQRKGNLSHGCNKSQQGDTT